MSSVEVSVSSGGGDAVRRGAGFLRPSRTKFGIRQQVFAAFGAIAAIAGVIAAYSLLSFHGLREGMTELAFGTMPALVAAQKMVDDTDDLLLPIESLAHARTEAERQSWLELSEERLSSLIQTRDRLADRFRGGEGGKLLGVIQGGLKEAIERLDAAVGARIAAGNARASMVHRSKDAYAAFNDAIKAVERRTRTVAILTLSITLPEAKGRDDLQSRISTFIEREMGWLATVQDLRSVASELLAAATTTTTEDDRKRLLQLRHQAQSAAPRMALVKRLPASRELTALSEAAETLVATVVSEQSDVFALRQTEIEAEDAAEEAFLSARVATLDSHNRALELLAIVSGQIDGTVNLTRLSIDWAERVIAGFTLLTAFGGFVILRRYVTRNLLARLHALKTCMLAGAADARASRPPAVLEELQAITATRRDEISEMAGSLLVFVEAIAEREQALQEAMQHAEAANRTKSQFLANMSHELRTPLNAILGFSEIIKDAVLGPVPSRYQSYAGDIHRSGRHLLAIINDVLDLSKIEAGRLELHCEEVAIAEIARACALLVAELAREKRLLIQLDVPDDAYIVADELRLKQVALNLLSNAVKFTPVDGWIMVSAHRNARGETVFAIADNGIGMTSEEIALALEAFRQVDATRARPSEGTGLGLPLARRLTELHGGRLELSSSPLHGTTVRAIFPAERTVLSPSRSGSLDAMPIYHGAA
jgi:signal transduction histidine kinase